MGNFIEVKVEGLDQVKARLAAFVTKYPEQVKSSLKTEAELIMTDSKKEVPVDTGSLRSSGFVDQPKQTGQTISIKLGYGGIATKINPKSGEITAVYAIYVHENMNVHHEVGKAKFLQDPIYKAKNRMLFRIASRVKRLLEEGGA